MSQEQAKQIFRSLKRRGLRAAFREPGYDEIRAFMRRRPYLEVACRSEMRIPLAHNETYMEESTVGWPIMDIGGERILTSPGPHLYESSTSLDSQAASVMDESTGEQSGLEQEPAPAEEPEASEPSLDDLTAGYETFWGQALATTEYVIAMAYNYEWPAMSIEGSGIMKRAAWVISEIIGLDNNYEPNQDDERCLRVFSHYLEEAEARLAATSGPSGGSGES